MTRYSPTPGALTLALLVAVPAALWWRDAGPPPEAGHLALEPAPSEPPSIAAGPGQAGVPSLASDRPERLAAEALPAQPQVRAKLVSEALELQVYFGEGETRLALEAEAALSQLASEVADADSVLRLRISAHSDDGPSEARNQALSDRRAQVVREFLERRGVKALRVEAAGYGSLFPELRGGAAPDPARNRRAQVRVEWVERLLVSEPAG
jgi:OOP family OmpA-OmpF porin